MPNLEQEIGSWDSVLLENLSEDSFISNLHQRYKRDHIYTYIGTFLISINPYKPLSLYTPDLVQTYATRGLFKLPPHIYAVANSAFSLLENHNEDQCIILSGESGSGKTETSRMVVHFLSQVSEIRKINAGKTDHNQQHQRNSVSTKGSQSNSRTSTPKHIAVTQLPIIEKTGCLSSDKFGSLKKCSHEKTVDFDFSHHKSTENLSSLNPIKCQKHSSSSNSYNKMQTLLPSSSSLSSSVPSTIISPTATIIKSCPKHNPPLKYSDMDTNRTVKSKCNSCLNKTNIKYNNIDNYCSSSSTSSASLSTIKLQHPTHNTISEQHLLSCNKTLNNNSKKIYSHLKNNFSHHNKCVNKTSLEYLDNNTETNKKCNCDNLFSNRLTTTSSAPKRIQNTKGLLKSIKINTTKQIEIMNINNTETKKIKERIAQADILLEALGNATTIKNANSSRFGKFFDIEFDFKGDPIGGHIMHYMLEKSRVIQTKAGERNFHIFYQLLAGADIQFLKSLKLQRNIDKYELLKHGTATDDDKNNFIFTKKSLETLELSQDEILSLFKIIAVVIKLGNLVFVPTTNIDGSEGCIISNEYELHETAQLLNIDEQILLNCLTRGNTNWNQLDSGPELDAVCASRIKNSLCVTLYGRLFTWAINRINEALKLKNYSRGKSLGILDFYGFEILENNSFEQLAINYCNERLHQNFLQNVLRMQQELYIREGLEWMHVDFFDNETICELIDKPNYGILSLLEEPQVSCDDTFFTRIHQCCSGHPNFLNQNLTLTTKCFQIRHFAGPVTYSVNKFLEKNLDILPKNISTSLFQSKLTIVQTLFPEGNPKRTSKKPSSLGSYLRTSIQTLLTTIDNRRCHYVFCIKPNENKQSRVFELGLVQHQVRYLSLMPLVNLWRSGHYFNIAHSKFLNRYKLLSPITWPHFKKGTLIEGIAIIIRSVPVPTAEFTIGRSRVFIRSPRTVFELEEFRKKRLDYLATLIQKTFRCYSHRTYFLKMKRSQIIISSAYRTWRECRFGIPFKGRRHLWAIYRVAKEEYRIMKYRKQVEWAVTVLQRQYTQWKRRQFLLTLPLRFPTDSMSPLCLEWPLAPRFLAETSQLLRNIYHRWRCYKYRKTFDQTSRNRLREKVTASIIFKDRKSSYNKSVSHPFLGDYVRLRQNVQWKKLSVESNDQYVVFADIINKITRSSGKFVPILLVLSTSSMLLLDQRTLQVKYRVPATEIYRLSLSPYLDDIAVFHVKADHCNTNHLSGSESPTGCLFQSELGKKKGDFVFQTGHVIEIVTKLFLVIQNATAKPPEVHISTEFEANFGQQTVLFTFKCGGLAEVQHGQPKVSRKGNRMEIIV